jgi:hypothetical protein
VSDCYDDDRGVRIHVFECEDGEVTPRDRRCACERATWGEMDDLLTLTEMWERV